MLSKKSIKIISTILLIAMLLMSLGSVVLAGEIVTVKPTDSFGDTNIDNSISTILGYIQYGGLIAAVVIGMYVGIKYITSSPDGKAEVKKTITFYIIGIAILLSASSIVGMIKSGLGK